MIELGALLGALLGAHVVFVIPIANPNSEYPFGDAVGQALLASVCGALWGAGAATAIHYSPAIFEVFLAHWGAH